MTQLLLDKTGLNLYVSLGFGRKSFSGLVWENSFSTGAMSQTLVPPGRSLSHPSAAVGQDPFAKADSNGLLSISLQGSKTK